MSYFEFQSLDSVFVAAINWGLLGSRVGLPKIVKLPNGNWAVRSKENHTPELAMLLHRYGGQLTEGKLNADDEIPFEKSFSSQWRSLPTSLGIPISDETGSQAPEWIIGCRQESQAVRIGEILLSKQALGIKAAPLAASAPFNFLWRLTHGLRVPTLDGQSMQQVPPVMEALELADRTWWGPAAGSETEGVEVFVEWPYQLDLPLDDLAEALGEERQLLLLSPNEPRHVAITPGIEEETFHELIDLFDVESPGDAFPVRTALESNSEASPLPLPIELSLVRRLGAGLEEERLHQSELRIKQLKEEHYRRLRALGRHRKISSRPVEPLLVFISDDSNLSPELRQILLEWSDDEKALGALRHLKVFAEDWCKPVPEQIHSRKGDPKHIHIVTTASAIQRSDSDTTLNGAGLRLLDESYKPNRGYPVIFERLPEWAPFGLSLFVPYADNRRELLQIYPNISPSAASAAKLAAVLLPQTEGDPRDQYAALLVKSEGQTDRLRCIHLPLQHFHTLPSAIDWQFDHRELEQLCLTITDVADTAMVTQLVDEAIDSHSKALDHRFQSEYKKLADKRKKISECIVKASDAISKLKEELSGLERESRRVESAQRRGNELMRNLSRTVNEVSQTAKSLQKDANGLRAMSREVDSLASEFESASRELSRLKEENS